LTEGSGSLYVSRPLGCLIEFEEAASCNRDDSLIRARRRLQQGQFQMRLSGLIGLAMLGGCLALPSCGGDDDDGEDTGGSAGTTGGKGGSSGKGGSAGSSSGGKAGGAGSSSGGKAGSSSNGLGGEAGDDTGSGGTAGSGGDDTGSGGTAGEAGSPSSGGSGGNSGEAGTSGSAGESGAPGGGGEAGGSGDPDTQSTACSAFPETVTLGPTITVDTFGAVLCGTANTSTCRLTTNTYGDGTNPCEEADRVGTFLASESIHTLSLQNTWHINSSTAGTIDSSNDYYMSAIPTGTSVTAIIEDPDGDTYSLVFEFGTGQSFTITSFTETT
jgi:hypothetical protein